MEEDLSKYEGYYDDPNWLEKRKRILTPELPVNLAPGSLNLLNNDAPDFEATGSLNVNVRGPRGTVVKADGTGPFETVNMSRQMTNGA